MQISIICRICETTNTNNLFDVNSYSKKYPAKVFADLLHELAPIDIKNGMNENELPQKICSACVSKLDNAYDFVVQVRQANDRIFNQLRERKDLESQKTTNNAELINKQIITTTADCLQETPMDVLEVIVKTEIEESYFDADDKKKFNIKSADPLFKIEQCTESSSSEFELVDKDEPFKPCKKAGSLIKRCSFTKKRTIKRSERVHKCDKCDKSYYWPQNLRLHKQKHLLESDWHTCPHCEQKFGSKNNYYIHLKKHGDQNTTRRPVNLSENQRAKDIDINFCKPNGCKMIQCMICMKNFKTFTELRYHLQSHKDNITLSERNESFHEVAESLYPYIKNITKEQLLARIRKDLKAEKYALFYSITNESGYELSLDSSETESDDCDDIDLDDLPLKEIIKTQKKLHTYTCDICNLDYKRKYELFEHQRQKHEWLEAQHICVRCGARFLNEKLLSHHYKSLCRNSLKRLICRKCPLRFRWQHNLKAHYLNHKKKIQVYECSECDRSYTDKKSYSIHKLTAHVDQSKLMPCHWCDRKFYRRDYLLKHLKRHGIKEKDLPLAETYVLASSKANGTKNIICRVCNLNFERIVELRAHLLIDLNSGNCLHQNYDSMQNYSITNELGFELDVNDSETDDEKNSSSTLNKKINPMENISYTCELCKVQCWRKFEMMRHQRAMHRFDNIPFECDQCVFKSVSKIILEHHKRSQCQNKEKKFVCIHCNYKFMWAENLEHHMKTHHVAVVDDTKTGNINEITTEASSNIETNSSSTALLPTLQCPHCDRTYVMQFRLNNHIRDVHTEGNRKKKDANKKFLCSLCGLEAQSAAELVTHTRRHTGEKPFKCDLCDMAFARRSDMTGHRRKHTGEKPFHCTVCGKDFARSDKLKRHMLIHSGLKPYKCTYCEKCYRQSKDLTIHLQQHTGESPFICETCGERFLLSTTLEKHRMMRGHFTTSVTLPIS